MSKKNLILLLLVFLLSLPLGMRLAGETKSETPLGNIHLSLAPSWSGEAEFYVPLTDWGVRVDLFDSPLALRAEPGALNRDNLLRVASGDNALIKESQEDIGRGVVSALLRVAVLTLLVSLILSLLPFPLFLP